MSPTAVNRLLSMIAAAAAAVVPILIDVHVITSTVGADIGTGVAILIAGWHGNTATQSLLGRRTTPPGQ